VAAVLAKSFDDCARPQSAGPAIRPPEALHVEIGNGLVAKLSHPVHAVEISSLPAMR
jgi:hypothetical protein